MKKWQPKILIYTLPVLAITLGALAPMPASAAIAEECFSDQCTITFGYTGQIEQLTFPANAINVRFEVFGAQGGKSGGAGGLVVGEFVEVPSIIYITVGGAGGSSAFAEGGFNGGGTSGGSAGVEGSGGGASDIRLGLSLSSRIVVAGGGGGRGSGLGSAGGAGGGLVGVAGRTGQATGGSGGSQDAGGAGGLPNGEGVSGTAGDWGVGGAGGFGPLHGGGGGGGGYYGGGGGGPDAEECCTDSGGGGGGSSYTDAALISNVVHSQGVRAGAGQITFSYQLIVPLEPTPPNEDLLTPPIDPTNPPTEETVVTPTAPANPTENSVRPPDVLSPAPEALANHGQAQVMTEVVSPKVASNQSNQAGPRGIAEPPKETDSDTETSAVDEILQRPSDLQQAAQSVVVPVQNKKQPFSSSTLFAGLIGLGLFALIAGLVVARRGVPGAISS